MHELMSEVRSWIPDPNPITLTLTLTLTLALALALILTDHCGEAWLVLT